MIDEEFNCGRRLKEIMHEMGWDHREVAHILGRKSISSVSTKMSQTDLRISEIQKLMNAAGKNLYEFIISKEELGEIYGINPLLIDIIKKINYLPKNKLFYFAKMLDAIIDVSRLDHPIF
jgi:hypothetical protein